MKIAASQLELLKWANTRSKGFTVDDAMAKFKAPRQSTLVRLNDAFERGWLAHKWEASGKGAPRSRFVLNTNGAKMLAKKWVGKGRFRTLEK